MEILFPQNGNLYDGIKKGRNPYFSVRITAFCQTLLTTSDEKPAPKVAIKFIFSSAPMKKPFSALFHYNQLAQLLAHIGLDMP